MSATSMSTDTIDLADIARALRRGWRLIVGGLAAGLLVALLVILFGPRRFDASTSAIVRTANDPATSLLSRVGGEAGAAAGALLGGAAASPIETEIQILTSAAIAARVVDSLHLQAEPRAPERMAAALLFSDVALHGGFKPTDVTFSRTAPGQYAVTGAGPGTTARPGVPVVLLIGTVTLRDSVPATFTVRFFNREDALSRFAKNLGVMKAGGEVVRVGYRASDSLTAATVPNAVLANYLARRKTSDRGVNAHRVEFLTQQLDSTAQQLAAAEASLRQFQERSGMLDPQVIGKLALENAADLRKGISAVEVEQGALDQMLAQVTAGKMSARQLAAYPSFLKSPGINELLKQLSELETERTKLLDRRLETDDEVVALSRSIANTEGQLVPLARAYSSSLQRQKADISRQLGTLTSALGTFPGNAQSSARLLRDVLRLSQIYAALQGQLVTARLSAISEGGDVRVLDVATPPMKPSFPQPLLTAGMGGAVGLLAGLLGALLLGTHGRWLEDPHAIERAVGVPALRFDPTVPFLMSGRVPFRTVLLIPVGEAVSTTKVAARLADTALARGEEATVLDLTAAGAVAPLGTGVGAMLARMEQQHGLVIVRLPGLTADSTAAALRPDRPVLLVAPSRRISRRDLLGAVETLRRLEVPCAGIVLTDAEPRAALNA